MSLCSDPKRYNLENLRASYLTAPEDISAYSTTTGKYTSIPLIIEYDGRVLSDPPPGLAE